MEATKPKQNRGNRPKPTPQQARAIALFKENVVGSGTLSVEDILLAAGYAPESARQQSHIMAGIRPHLDPFVERMERHREKVMTRMEERVEDDRADYAELTRALHTLTQNIRLLSGKSTQNLGVLVADRRQEIDRLIDE